MGIRCSLGNIPIRSLRRKTRFALNLGDGDLPISGLVQIRHASKRNFTIKYDADSHCAWPADVI